MTTRDEIEQAIREALASETQAMALSQRLFAPDGLFSRLGATENERRSVVQSPLFQEAQRRLSELQRHEAAEFARAVPPTLIPGSAQMKLERRESA
jgi:hypothetical protein